MNALKESYGQINDRDVTYLRAFHRDLRVSTFAPRIPPSCALALFRRFYLLQLICFK